MGLTDIFDVDPTRERFSPYYSFKTFMKYLANAMFAMIAFLIIATSNSAYAQAIENVSRIVITHADGGNTPIQVSEIIVTDDNTLHDVALANNGATAIASGTFGSVNRFGAHHTIDGISTPGSDALANYFHSSGNAADSLIITLPSPTSVSRLEIVGRADCCQFRDRYSIQLQDAAGVPIEVVPLVVPEEPSRRATVAFSTPADPAILGSWGEVKNWPLVAVSMANLPDGRLLTYSGSERRTWPTTEQTYSVVWDPETDTFSERLHTGHNMFCGTLSMLEDGRVLVAGGRNGRNSPWTTAFDHTDNDWTPLENMASGGRWYPTTLTLGNGNVFSAMGSATNVKNPDLWSPATGWRVLNGIDFLSMRTRRNSQRWFPLLSQAPNGSIFHFWDPIESHFISADGNGSSTPANSLHDSTEHAGGVQVMYDEGKLLISGSNDGSWRDALDITRSAYTVDLNAGTPVINSTQPMTFPRIFHNFVVLPTGEVLAVGGNTTGAKFEDIGSVLDAEIWNPTTGEWRITAPMSVARDYHSTALLLKDGSVISAGGGYSPGNPNSPGTHQDAQIYYPPYLYDQSGELAQRPAITPATSVVTHGESFLVTSNDIIEEFTLLRLSSVTHSVNTDQRFFRPDFTSLGNGSYQLTMHDNENVAIPGYWMLFGIDDKGVPSEAQIIQIKLGDAVTNIDNEPAQISPIISSPIQTGTSVTYTADAIGSGLVYSWNFGDGSGDTSFLSDESINHVFSAPGRYVVTVTVRNALGVDSVESFTQMIYAATTDNGAMTSNAILELSQQSEVWVSNPDNNTVSVVDLSTLTRTSEIAVGENPRSLALAPNGRVWVVNKDSASLSIIDPAARGIINTLPLPPASRPHGIVFNDHSAYIALESIGEVIQLDALTGDTKSRQAAGLRPRHLSISGDGSTLYVSNYLTEKLPGEDTGSPDVSNGAGTVRQFSAGLSGLANQRVIRLQHSNRSVSENEGPGIANYLGPFILSPDGQTGWMPSKQDNILAGTLRGGPGITFDQTVRAVTSKVDLQTGNEILSARIDHDNASVVSSGAFGPNGLVLFTTLEGNRQVALIDTITNLEYSRFNTGRAPQSLLLSASGTRLYVHNFLERSLGIYNIEGAVQRGDSTVDQIATVNLVSNESLANEILRGKQLFYDSRDDRLAGLNYMSCAACHNDGEHDGRTWDFTSLGEGLRNTTSLRGMGKATGRLHWSANFDEVQDFEIQLRNFNGGEGLMADEDFFTGTTSNPMGSKKAGLSNDLDALAAYVESLETAIPSPWRSSGTLNANGEQGRATFASAGCASCHSGATFTDSESQRLHDVGTLDADSGNRNGGVLNGLDTPSLLGAWSSAPYLHDGSADTLMDAIAAHSNQNLDGPALANLAAFVAQIDSDEPLVQPGAETQDSPTPDSEEPFSFAANIVIDGDFGDWPIEALLATDPKDTSGGGNRLDFMRVWAAHDQQNMFFRYDNHAPNDVELVWGNSIGIDTNGAAIGYTGGFLPVGIDFLIEGELVYRYNGDGISWSWQGLVNAEVAITGRSLELLVPRTAIGNPETFNLIFTADNAAVGGSAVDFVPDSVPDIDALIETRYLTYALNGTVPAPTETSTPSAVTFSNQISTLSIDGNLSDWAGIEPLLIDPEDVAAADGNIDFLSIWAAHDNNHLYFAWQNDGPTAESWGNAIFFDTDLSISTGFRGFMNDSPIGVDYLSEGSSLFRYMGTGNDWNWEYLGDTTLATNGDVLELQIPLDLMGNVETFDIFLRGDSAALGGSGVDFAPDAANRPSRQQSARKIRYSRANGPNGSAAEITSSAAGSF